MKIKVMAIGLLVVPSISLGAAEVLSRGDETTFQSKLPVKVLDVEAELEGVSSAGSEREEGYAGDRENDEDGKEQVRGMRSSDDSTPAPFTNIKKKYSRIRGLSRERLKEKFNETLGSLKGRISPSGSASSGSVSESDEADSAYEDSIVSQSPRADHSLSPIDRSVDPELTAVQGASSDEILERVPERKKSLMPQLRTRGMSRAEHQEAYSEYLDKKRSPSAPPGKHRDGFRRHDTLKSKSDTRHNRMKNIGDNYGKSEA